MAEKKKVAIIGAGISGLTAGIYALKAGFDAEIYERNASVGGLCTGWYRKGSYIDGCIHWLTESNRGVLNKLWREIGAIDENTTIFHYDIYNQACMGDTTVNFYTDPAKLEKELLSFADGENDRRLVKKFVKGVRICKHNALTGGKPFHLWNAWNKFRFICKILPIIGVVRNYSKLSTREFVAQLKSPALKYTFSNTLVPDEYSLFSLMSTFGGLAHRNSGTPIGGSKAMVERIKDKFLSLGGKLTLRADVESIDIENEKACGLTTSDGQHIKADYVIAACDVHFTLDKLLNDKYHIEQIDDRDSNKKHHPTYSMMLLSYRTKKDLSEIVHNRYVKCPTFNVLGDDVDVIYLKHFGYDKTIMHDGYTIVQAIVTTTESMFDKLAAMPREEYADFKKQLSETITDRIQQTEGDRYGELELLDVATPLTFTHYVNTYKGTFMTYMLTPNIKQMILRNDILPVKNLALANHWLMVPGGVPIAVMQGKFAAMTIAYNDKHQKD